MPRPKATINSVDLTRAIKAIRAGGLTISYTKLAPDGTVTIVTVPELPAAGPTSPEDALANWQEQRKTVRLT